MRFFVITLVLTFLLLPVLSVNAEELDYELKWTYRVGDKYVSSVDVSLDGKYVVIGGVRTVYFLDNSGKLLWTYGFGWTVNDVSIHPDSTKLCVATGGGAYLLDSGGYAIWSWDTKYRGYYNYRSYSCSISGDSILIAAHGRRGEPGLLYFLNIDGKPVSEKSIDIFVFSSGSASSADGKLFCVAGDYKVYCFDSVGNFLWGRDIQNGATAVSVSPDGKYVAVGDYNGIVYIFTEKGDKVLSFGRGGFRIYSLDMTEDASLILVGSKDPDLYIFNRDRKVLWMNDKLGKVTHVAISKDGRYIVASSGNTVYFFERVEKRETPTPTPTPVPTPTQIEKATPEKTTVPQTPKPAATPVKKEQERATPGFEAALTLLGTFVAHVILRKWK